jgi:hypothetical protein
MLTRATARAGSRAVAATLVLTTLLAHLAPASAGAGAGKTTPTPTPVTKVAGPKAAVPATAPTAPLRLALAPLSTLGAAATGKEATAITTTLAGALAAIPAVTVVEPAAVIKKVDSARQPLLKACDGDVGCLADLGALVGVDQVVFGELGGIGDAQVVYLTIVDVAKRAQLRATTLQVSTAGTAPVDGGAPGAAIRLVAPERYQGTLRLAIDVPGASVYLNGQLIGTSPMPDKRFGVGTHAVRVTHPEYRDFVRFVDLDFDATATVEVGLQQFPIIKSAVAAEAEQPTATVITREAPAAWYRRWYVIAAAGLLTGVAVGVTAAALSSKIDPAPDYTRPL